MTRLLFITFWLGCALSLNAQNINFHKNDDFIKVVEGNIVEIKADTAFVVSKSRAEFLNNKLDELQKVQEMYTGLLDNRNELNQELKTIQKLMTKLAANLEKDSAGLSGNLTVIVADLDKTLVDLKDNNQTLSDNNASLLAKTDELKRIVKDLKKETRGLWWNGLTDKLVAFAGGVGIGILLAAVL